MRNIRPYIAMRVYVIRAFFLIAIVVFGASSTANAAEIVVSAAASLSDAFRAIGKAFEKSHTGTTVTFNFAASDVLLAQIAKGAPADVFAAADDVSMDRAEREGLLLPGARFDFAGNRLVLIVPPRAPAPAKLDELAFPRFGRIAIGSPRTVPAGRYAQAALDRAHLWEKIERRCVFALNVRQVLDYVARSEVDAGIVYATDAAVALDKVKVVLDVPTAVPIRYPVAVLRATHHESDARAFAESLRGEAARNILVAYGFALR